MTEAARPRDPARWRVAVARARPVLAALAIGVVLVLPVAARVLGLDGGRVHPVLVVAVAVVGLAPTFASAGAARTAPRTIAPPVRGRWQALNSPASRVPSHGTLAYGQSHAVDLVHEPVDGPERPASSWPPFRRPDDHPAFGAAALAPVDGTVVRVSDWRRDHRTRTGPVGIAYLLLEGVVRELGGSGFVIGNHVVIRGDDGACVLVAHLRRGSAAVEVGDRVTAGAPVGEVGNSGNSTEPHVHLQLMDHDRASTAVGLPFALRDVEVGGESQHGVPVNGAYLVTGPGGPP